MKALKIGWLCLLSGVVAGCGQQVKMPPMMQVTHRYDKAFQQQESLLNAEKVEWSVHRTQIAADSAISRIDLVVLNPKGLPATPDSVVKQTHKLAHLLVANLSSPQDYQVMTVTIATQQRGIIVQNTNARTITYSIASLK
ncbi:hypothetical protein QMK33_03765 [Hymenobacter sp. H14-R3]|uniref:hypothetical protein n=1 Tax=Hymenobacter sp. H14-R3 TaxID=3046308 RepID=UPI0024B90357|nr:hypothetical protein [Hymenobacter sp. H14-R3]MDJ0364254.1 hypothetical protein [Hymenobacter sp. H14-R3]